MIAWISHHVPDHTGKLVGGAEMTDATLLADAPVEVKTLLPQDWKQAMDFDQVVITGTDLLSPWAMLQLAKKNPVIAVHHQQTQNEHRATLLSSAKTLICHSPKHLELELAWTNPKSSTWILSPHDPSLFTSKPKEEFALWAARMHHQKGPEEAKQWANQRGIPLVLMHNNTRAEVLETMSRAKHFVFLPNGFDAEPRTIIEAVLSGCEVHSNELAGITSIPNWHNPETMANLVSNSKELFWSTVLQ